MNRRIVLQAVLGFFGLGVVAKAGSSAAETACELSLDERWLGYNDALPEDKETILLDTVHDRVRHAQVFYSRDLWTSGNCLLAGGHTLRSIAITWRSHSVAVLVDLLEQLDRAAFDQRVDVAFNTLADLADEQLNSGLQPGVFWLAIVRYLRESPLTKDNGKWSAGLPHGAWNAGLNVRQIAIDRQIGHGVVTTEVFYDTQQLLSPEQIDRRIFEAVDLLRTMEVPVRGVIRLAR